MTLGLRILALLLITLPRPAVAQSDDLSPQKSGNGDWLTNVGPVSGRVSSPKDQAGALWKVVAPQLNCRQLANPASPIRQTFKQGTLLQANVGRGGSDEVLRNARDSRGRTWMWVRTAQGQNLNCYVRAHVQFIQPVLPPKKPG